MSSAHGQLFTHPLLLKKFGPQDELRTLQALPFEIILHSIMPHLSVGDIVSLRKVNTAFYLLTHDPRIWRALLIRFHCPLPLFPNNIEYLLRPHDLQAELLVRNFVSMQQAWESDKPELLAYDSMATHGKITEIVVLPGGEYAVCIVKSVDHGFRVVVSTLDGSCFGLASIATDSEPYDLKAKYMDHGKGAGITLWYTVYSAGKHEESDTEQMVYTCHTAHIGLDTLTICARNLAPLAEPISFLFESITFEYGPVIDVNLFTHPGYDENGNPATVTFMLSVLLPNEIALYNLTTNEARTFICEPNAHQHVHGYPQQVRAARLLNADGDVLVIRTAIGAGLGDVHMLEMYSCSNYGRFRLSPTSGVMLPEYSPGSSLKVSEPMAVETSQGGIPHPISIYVQTQSPRFIVHYTISATQRFAHGTAPWWAYDLKTLQSQATTACPDEEMFIVPGTKRGLILSHTPEDKSTDSIIPKFNLTSVRRYFNPETPALANILRTLPTLEGMQRTLQLCAWRPRLLYRTIRIPEHTIRRMNAFGISAVGWDESSGRTCIATKQDERLHILDVADMPKPDECYDRFDSLQHILKVGRFEPRSPALSTYSDDSWRETHRMLIIDEGSDSEMFTRLWAWFLWLCSSDSTPAEDKVAYLAFYVFCCGVSMLSFYAASFFQEHLFRLCSSIYIS
ncbi:hypothetical protein CYLTODRAFT_487676 [Cylindrobasidium torrendii FP15055 ss-10]|uniref:F-box domain-containing protein n=1 Tax=Cylindrobasidium torrendii FP15055 ss-10 TaxID=1314674 RepID=A0A0D7BL91_9AGAR|nr:hypothetical protein CYLTODRAFT_487676 [Cylindrobasidium torrendii FP15055 ss-10]